MDKCYEGNMQAMPFDLLERPDQDSKTRINNALITALIFLAVIAVATFIILAVVYFNCTSCLVIYASAVFPISFALFTLTVFKSITNELNIAADWYTIGFFTWNIVGVGMCWSMIMCDSWFL